MSLRRVVLVVVMVMLAAFIGIGIAYAVSAIGEPITCTLEPCQ